jgi:hypothetical protein
MATGIGMEGIIPGADIMGICMGEAAFMGESLGEWGYITNRSGIITNASPLLNLLKTKKNFQYSGCGGAMLEASSCGELRSKGGKLRSVCMPSARNARASSLCGRRAVVALAQLLGDRLDFAKYA